jgi:hypothetical protein
VHLAAMMRLVIEEVHDGRHRVIRVFLSLAVGVAKRRPEKIRADLFEERLDSCVLSLPRGP